MHKILITGGSGFIGTNAVEHFKRKYEVLNVDWKEPKIPAHKEYWKNIDINDKDKLSVVVNEFSPDYILHLAARTDLDGLSLEDYSQNIRGVKNLVEITKTLPNLKKIVLASSMLVCHVGYTPKDQFDYSATTWYGKSKVETEKIVWESKMECDWALIRPTSIWGPWFGVPYRNFFDMVKRRMYFHIGHKGCTKTYGFVGNAIYQIEQILTNKTKDRDNKVFYIGDEPAIPIEEWAEQIAGELGFKVPRLPWWMVKTAALTGDALYKIGIYFPMTSFRLKNMTTDNIMPLKNTYEIAPFPPYSRMEGIKQTLKWMNEG